ncbi:MAG TPA: PAS domain-containing protein, partial [Candidatus Nitrosotenuis sp.]|nr:PAS domain-containing protein [Candidatus Nitrosotenuis sp.]
MPPRIEGQLGDALVEGLEDGCVGMDRAGVVRIFNPKAEALLGVRAREVVGRKIWDALPLSDFTRAFIAQIKQSSPAPLEQAMVFPGERLVLVRLQAVRTDQGRNLGAVAVLRDMAGVQKLEKGLDQVLQDVTSQLIVPLTSIKGFVETLLEGPYQNAEITRRFLHVINEETNRLVRVVMSLREAAAPPAPQVRVRPTSLEPLLRSAVEMFRGLAEQKNLRLTLEIPPDLPLVEVDGERL